MPDSPRSKPKFDEISQQLTDLHERNIVVDTREIYLHSVYGSGEEAGIDYRVATTFMKNMHFLQRQGRSNILVHSHTIGGDWNDGMMILHAMRLSKCVVNMISYGVASSMSGIVLQGADKRIMYPDCDFMIHHGSIYIEDSSRAAKEAVAWNDKACKRMLDIFAQRAKTGKFFKQRKDSVGRIKSYIDKKLQSKVDWYLTAEEAVYYGFADGIFGEKGFEESKIRTGSKYKGPL
jgi:pentatricopeptide repeat protein